MTADFDIFRYSWLSKSAQDQAVITIIDYLQNQKTDGFWRNLCDVLSFRKRGELLLAKEAKTGMFAGYLCATENSIFIVDVVDDYRRKGLGRKLVTEAENTLRKCPVYHVESLDTITGFWRALGYSECDKKHKLTVMKKCF